MADEFQEKTEQPTPKRQEEARKKGNVARSIEVNSAISLLTGITLLYITAGIFYQQFSLIMKSILSGGYLAELRADYLMSYLLRGFNIIGIPLLLVMIGLMIVGLISNLMQVGFYITFEPILPRLDKINPISGFKKVIFSRRSLEELIKNILKLTVVILIAYYAIMDYKEDFIPLMDQNVSSISVFMLKAALKISYKIGLIFLFIAAADYAFQKFEHIRNLKMSKQEVKDEFKQAEGDPKIKARIRSMQLEMVRRRMMHEVPKADVVITNPTHYAVALKYEPEKMNAPKVVAKGQNLIAQKIRRIAEEHQVPIVEDPPLARALFKAVDIGQEIPEKFFQAVAEVLAFVYKLQNKRI